MVGFGASVIYVSIYFNFVASEEKPAHLRKIFGVIAAIALLTVYSKVMKAFRATESLNFHSRSHVDAKG